MVLGRLQGLWKDLVSVDTAQAGDRVIIKILQQPPDFAIYGKVFNNKVSVGPAWW